MELIPWIKRSTLLKNDSIGSEVHFGILKIRILGDFEKYNCLIIS